MRVAIYNENCVRAGRIAADDAEIDEYREQNDGQDCGDWTVYEAEDARALYLYARNLYNHALKGAAGQHQRKVARSLRDYAEDLDPTEWSVAHNWDAQGTITADSEPEAEFRIWQKHAEASPDWFGDEFTEADFRDYIESLAD